MHGVVSRQANSMYVANIYGSRTLMGDPSQYGFANYSSNFCTNATLKELFVQSEKKSGELVRNTKQ
jgi:hypothetical protein